MFLTLGALTLGVAHALMPSPDPVCEAADAGETITITKDSQVPWSMAFVRLYVTVSHGNQPTDVVSVCAMNGLKLSCSQLGQADMEEDGSGGYTVELADFSGIMAGTLVGMEATPGVDSTAVTTKWFRDGCFLEPAEDEGTCNQLAMVCGYQECNASHAIETISGSGCAGLMCHCQTADGTWYEDAVTTTEMESGNLSCNRVSQEPLDNPAPPADLGVY